MEDDIVQEEGEERKEFQAKIETAIRSRIQHFKDQSDSLTLDRVRRVLEEDLGLQKYALDVHKKFIRQQLEKQMGDSDDQNSKSMKENVEKDANSSQKEVSKSPTEQKTKKDPKQASNGDEETMEESPVIGLLNSKSEVDKDNQDSVIRESRIKKAIWGRADHFRANTEKITMAGVRRLLEEDLGLDKNTLDPFKKLISEEIDQVLNLDKVSENANNIKKKSSEKSQKEKSEKTRSAKGFDSSDAESDKGKDKVKSRKKAPPRAKDKKSDGMKKRKRSRNDSDSDVSDAKQRRGAKRPKEEDNDSGSDERSSEDGQAQSSVGKSVKRKEQSTPGYGKKVEHLRSIIKSCGMSVAPSVYKKAKQVPDDKRETFLVKELEGILKREGLSSNPTEKEIKDCRKRKERAKELEGIDMSNIISSSRRRSTSSYMTPKSKVETEGDKNDAKSSKTKGNKDKDSSDSEEKEAKEEKEGEEGDAAEEENEKDEGEEDDDEDEEGEGDDSQSEEFNEDDDEESD